jgi:aminoglycoside phosphotransferase (APT) family kinase protein
MRRVVGQPLGARHTAAAREAGAYLARFHRLGAQPPFTSGQVRWEDHMCSVTEWILADLEPRGIFDPAHIARFRRYYAAKQGRFARRPIELLHGDMQPDHVMVDEPGERVVAFLDFADAQPGDPLFDLAVLTLTDDALVAPLLAGYAAIPDDAETRELLAAYRLLRRLGSISWLLDRSFDHLADEYIAAVMATAP